MTIYTLLKQTPKPYNPKLIWQSPTKNQKHQLDATILPFCDPVFLTKNVFPFPHKKVSCEKKSLWSYKDLTLIFNDNRVAYIYIYFFLTNKNATVKLQNQLHILFSNPPKLDFTLRGKLEINNTGKVSNPGRIEQIIQNSLIFFPLVN